MGEEDGISVLRRPARRCAARNNMERARHVKHGILRRFGRPDFRQVVMMSTARLFCSVVVTGEEDIRKDCIDSYTRSARYTPQMTTARSHEWTAYSGLQLASQLKPR